MREEILATDLHRWTQIKPRDKKLRDINNFFENLLKICVHLCKSVVS